MSDDLDDLLGLTEAPSKPSRAEMLRLKLGGLKKVNPDAEAMVAAGQMPPTATFLQPVGITFLAAITRMKPEQVKKKLKSCNPVSYHERAGQVHPLYDFMDAIAYIVPPKIDIADWIQTQNAATLPNHINKTFWEAMNAKQRFMTKAGHLWHDADVLEVLGRTAMMIREETRLWIENLPGKAEMTDAQYNALTKNVSELLESIHERLVKMPHEFRTVSQSETMDAEIAAAGTEDVREE